MRVLATLLWGAVVGATVTTACGGDSFVPSSGTGGSGAEDGGVTGGTSAGGAGGTATGGTSGGGSGGTATGGGGQTGGSGGSAQCGQNQTLCDGVCVNTSNDLANCGACGQACSDPVNGKASCSSGACGVKCSAPYADCDGDLTNGCESDTESDSKNCGGCKSACPVVLNASATCTKGACGFQCAAPYDNCDSNAANGCEIDLSKDPLNCSGCGKPCAGAPTGAKKLVCAASKCTCDAGLTQCSAGSGSACVNASKDPQFCGGCNKCPDGQICVGSQCKLPACAHGLIQCTGDTTCRNLASDWDHCGACGNKCGFSDNCVSGACVSKNSYCTTLGKIECTDKCVDTGVDSANCGSCDVKCAAGQACLGGLCKPLILALEPWECSSGNVACNIPNWQVKPAPYYCHTSCVLGGSPVPPGG
ncbi:MAG: hypothetical protein IPI67_17195 [Myxococcales bacterium]|nr:hypothetical protein [Myxococcales bacterium]